MSSLYTSDPQKRHTFSAPKASLSRLRAAALPPVMRFVHHIDRKTLLTLPANKAIIDTDIIICLKCRHRNAAAAGMYLRRLLRRKKESGMDEENRARPENSIEIGPLEKTGTNCSPLSTAATWSRFCPAPKSCTCSSTGTVVFHTPSCRGGGQAQVVCARRAQQGYAEKP